MVAGQRSSYELSDITEALAFRGLLVSAAKVSASTRASIGRARDEEEEGRKGSRGSVVGPGADRGRGEKVTQHLHRLVGQRKCKSLNKKKRKMESDWRRG